jgi:hypothetical protein
MWGWRCPAKRVGDAGRNGVRERGKAAGSVASVYTRRSHTRYVPLAPCSHPRLHSVKERQVERLVRSAEAFRVGAAEVSGRQAALEEAARRLEGALAAAR